jgi:hypothetical protein
MTAAQTETLSATGSGTDLSTAWEKAERDIGDEPTAAAVLVSDGGNNLGANPVRMAALAGFPIYTIGIGDTTVHRDAALSEILANEVTYINSVVPIDVRIRATGLDGRVSRLRLLDRNGAEIANQEVRFSGNSSEVTATLSFTATQVGHLRYSVALDSIPGEWSLANNRRSVMIRVLETRLQVVIFSGPPTSSLSAIRNTLESDSNFEVRAFIESARGGYLFGKTPNRDDLSSASLLVLINFPSERTENTLLGDMAQIVSQQKTALIFFAGPAVYRDKLAKLADAIPCQAQRQFPNETEAALREVSSHPALAGPVPLPISWSDLPPVFGNKGNFTVSPAAQVVASLSRVNLGVSEDEPAIALWSSGGRKGVAFLVWGTYRWKLGLARDERAASFHDELLGRLTRWLVSPSEEKRVRIAPNKSLFGGGERVVFQAQVYGADLAPRDDAAVSVRVQMGQRTESVPLQSRGHGRYEENFIPWGEGEYRFDGFAFAKNDTLGKDAGTFAVEAFNIEMLDTRQQASVLAGIAEASGGRYITSAEADTMLTALNFPPRTVEHFREIPLWNRAMMLWIIIGALGLEWFIRKRSGML